MKNSRELLTPWKCCLCGKTVRGWGNNPQPLADTPDAKCCDECNFEKVIPARIHQLCEGGNNINED